LGIFRPATFDVAFIEFAAHDTGYFALHFGNEHLECLALGREPKAILSQLAVS
jgi:hypothetical protein